MTIRIFSKKHNLYTNSPFWPSNQRTTSEFALNCNGKVLEIVNGGEEGVLERDSRDFIIEPWTGYFDIKGRKIYRGDILTAKNDPLYRQEVIWKDGSFICKSLSNPDDQMLLDMDVKVWKRVEISGNIHGVDFEDS
jgi:hypothetical protein